MSKITLNQRKLIADFLSNIGVAWFAAGVIGVFVNKTIDQIEIVKSLIWGIVFSLIFVSLGAMMVKEK